MKTERFRTVNAGSRPSRCSFDASTLKDPRFCLHRTQVSHLVNHSKIQPVGQIPKARTLLFSRFNHLVAANDNMCTRYIIHHACMHTITTPIVHCAKKRANPARSCRVRDKEEWVDYACEHCHAASDQ